MRPLMVPVSRISLALAGAVLLLAACDPEPSDDDPQRGAAPEPAAASTAPAAAAAAPAAASLPTGRYQCWRLGSMGDEVAGDLHVDDADSYRSLDAEGRYRFGGADGLIEWESGPLHQPSDGWVGVFTPAGTALPSGGRTRDDQIEIRRRADVQAGNAAAIQRCHFAG